MAPKLLKEPRSKVRREILRLRREERLGIHKIAQRVVCSPENVRATLDRYTPGWEPLNRWECRT